MLKDLRTKVKNKLKKFPVSKFLLWVIAFITLILLIGPSIYLGCCVLRLNCCITLIIVMLPFLTAISYFLLAYLPNKSFSQIFTDTKLRRFPLLMFFDPDPAKHYRFKPGPDWWKNIAEGDLLLRRHDNYTDGLILRQTGYFTHSGIAKKDSDGNVYVYHAVGAGIQKVPITVFAQCDDIVVLRITEESIKEFLKNKPHIDDAFMEKNKSLPLHRHVIAESKEEIPVVLKTDRKKIKGHISKFSIKKMICESGKELNLDRALRKRELSIYCMLSEYSDKILQQNWQSVITDLAEAYKNKNIPYDFSFNFTNPDKMSCVEFAWNCYKCMFPMHRIKRTHFTFFDIKKLRPYILAPDLFITEKDKAKAFTVKYSSIKDAQDHPALTRLCKKSKFKFWRFILLCVVCQFVLLFIAYLAQYYLILK